MRPLPLSPSGVSNDFVSVRSTSPPPRRAFLLVPAVSHHARPPVEPPADDPIFRAYLIVALIVAAITFVVLTLQGDGVPGKWRPLPGRIEASVMFGLAWPLTVLRVGVVRDHDVLAASRDSEEVTERCVRNRGVLQNRPGRLVLASPPIGPGLRDPGLPAGGIGPCATWPARSG